MYTKKVGAKPDFGDPVILSSDRGGTLLEHLCRQIHNSMVAQLNYARVGHKLKTLSSEVSKFVPNLVVHAKPVIKLTDLLSLVVDAVLAQRRQTEDVLLERTCLP